MYQSKVYLKFAKVNSNKKTNICIGSTEDFLSGPNPAGGEATLSARKTLVEDISRGKILKEWWTRAGRQAPGKLWDTGTLGQ